MERSLAASGAALCLFVGSVAHAQGTPASATPVASTSRVVADWAVHSRTRPLPTVVTPRAPVSVPAPSDAIVLFDGTSLDAWTSAGGPARWRLVEGAMETVKGTGTLTTRAGFGDVQLHIEWRTPLPAVGTDQDRGNSGVIFMGKYEVQVLDSYNSVTYADGQAGALYGQYPPLVNASRPPGEWQSYDIVFKRPRFDAAGALTSPATVTVLHNGVLVQDHSVLVGPTAHTRRPPYVAHADRLPLALQDHAHPVRYRNVWLRDLETTGSASR